MPNNKSKSSKKKKTQKKKKNTKWLDLKAFNDGYDFGDVTKTIAATTKRSAKNIKKEFTEIPIRTDTGTARHKLGSNSDFTRNRVITPEASKDATNLLRNFRDRYLKSGYLDDGYDFGDISKTTVATAENISKDVTRGAARFGEGFVDIGAGLFQGGAIALGNDELADKTEKFIQRDLTEEFGWDKKLRNMLPNKGLQTANIILNKGDYKSGSVFTEKSDPIIESAAPLAIVAATGGAALPLLGISAAGSGVEEAYNYKSKDGKNYGATYGEAMTYGLTSGVVEALTERLGGIKFGGRALDDGIKRKISQTIADKATRALVKTGWTAGAEGFEEVVAGVAQNAAKKLTFADDQTWKQIMVSDEAMEGYLDSAVGGALMGGGFGAVVNANAYKTGRDADTGLTDNETKVLQTETNKRVKKQEEERAAETRRAALETQVNSVIADREKSFGELSTEQKENIKKSVMEGFDFDTVDYSKSTLSKKERLAIEKEVDSDLRKGYIDLETIDSTLDPETTTKINELNELRQNSKDEAEQKNIENQIVELYKQRATTSDSLTQNDAYLRESIKQEGLKREAFTYETKDEQTKALADSFTKAGGKNDGKSHETFEFTAKAVKDFGIEAEFVNNEQLKDVLISNNKTSELKAIEDNDLIADAFVLEREGQPNKMFLNVDSPNLTKKVVGHETIHLLESSNEYDKLQALVKDYATTKGDWSKQESTYADRYKGMKNVSVPKEVTAELLGKYFSSDQTFIKDFATKEPNVFKKVYDNIKHLYKMATAGSREARQLQQMKRQFEKVYKEVSKTSTFKAQTKSHTGAPSNSLEFAKAQFSLQSTINNKAYNEAQADELYELLKPYEKEYTNDITGDATKGDEIVFAEAVFTGSYKKPKFSHFEIVEGTIVKDSYGSDKQQHTFTIETSSGDTIRRKGRNVYRYGTFAKPRDTEERRASLDEKHERGQAARSERARRKEEEVKFSLSKTDEEYLAAVNSGDMETAQRIVDEAAEKAMQNSAIRDNKGKLLKVYHGSPKDFNSFNDPNNTPYGQQSQFFFSPWRSKSEQYGNNVRAFYLNIENPELYDYDFNNIKEDDTQPYDGYIYTAEDMKLDIDADKMGDIEIVAYSPEQIKSADPVTYDDNGNVIPLSERFNEESNDIRFSLSTDSEGNTLTQGQQAFFRDSKVRDENGNLLVLYHGTPNGDFTVFKDGTYFTPNKKYADRYQNPSASSISTGKVATSPQTYAVYLNIKKPFDINDPAARKVYLEDYIKGGNAMGINPYLSDSEYNAINSIDWTEGEDLRDFLIENEYDYDGLVLDEGADGGYGDNVNYRGQSYVAFSPNQIKNVDNLNPTEDTDIRFSLTKKELAENFGLPEILVDQKVETLAKRMANLEDADQIYNETERFIRQNVEIETDIDMSDKAAISDLRKELNDARQYIFKTPLSLYTTGASKGRTVNQLLENVGYDKKTVGRRVNINQKNGISIETMYSNLGEIAPLLFKSEDPYSLTFDYLTEEDQLQKIIDVATSSVDSMFNRHTVYHLTDEEVNSIVKDYTRSIFEVVYERAVELTEDPNYVAPTNPDNSITSDELPYVEQQNTEAFANIDENNIPISEENIAPTEDELANLDKQREMKPPTAGSIDYMVNHAKAMAVDLEDVFNEVGVTGFSDMSNTQYMKGIDYINEIAIAPVNGDLTAAENDELDFIVDSITNPKTEAPETVEDLHGYESKEALQRMLDYQGVKTYEEHEARIKKSEAEKKIAEAEKQIEEPIKETPKIEKQVNDEQNDIITRTRKQLKQELLADNKDFLTNAMDNAKNLPRKFMNNVDTIRNTEMVFGREAGRKINEIIFQRALNNEARRIYWLNRERDDIRNLGIKPKSKMSAAVQKIGEGQFVNEFGDIQEYGEAELRDEFPKKEDRIKIQAAADSIRQKYDSYIEAANNVLTDLGFNPIPVRDDYMRHFQELTDAFSRFGIPFNPQSMKEHVLPTHINGITEFFTPQKNYFANAQPRKGFKTTLDAITGVDGYLEGISNLIFHTEDIQRGRAFEDLIRETYGNDENLGWKKIEELPEEEQAQRIALVEGNHLSKYASWVHEWTNNMAGKKNKLDRVIEESFDRDSFSVLDWVRKQVGSNMIGFNLASSLTNLIAPMQALAKTKKIPFAKGMVDSFKNIFINDGFVDQNAFLTSRFGSDQIVKTKWERLQSAGYVFMKGVDHYSSNLIVRSKYYELLGQGMDSKTAHAQAGQFAARIMGDRSKGANAAFYNSKLFNVVGQFQLEVNNQLYSMFYDTYHDSKENAKGSAAKMAAGMTFTLGQMFAYTHLFGKAFEGIAGYNPTFDVIGIIMTALGIGDDDEDKTQSERLEEAAMQLLKALPYSNLIVDGGRIPISKAFPIKELVAGKDQYGNDKSRLDTLMETIPYYAVPTGYGQIKKTMGGLAMFDTDNYIPGSYTDDGDLRYWVEQTPKSMAQAAIFGQWANPTAREYIEGEHKPLSPKQQKELAYTSFDMEEYWDYRQELAKEKKFEDKFNYIADLDIPVSEKNVLVNNIGESKYPIDMGITDTYEEYEGYQQIQRAAEDNPEIWDYVDLYGGADNYMEYKDALYNIHSDKDASGKTIYNSRKNKVADYINNLDIDYETKLLLWKSQYTSDDTYNTDIINYLNERDDISFIQMKRILTDLGFEVGADGSIRW